MTPDFDDLIGWLMGALAAVAVASLCAQSARAGEPVLLKSSPSVRGERITFADVFENPGEVGATTLVAAPAPGASRSLDADWLVKRAASAGLTWSNPGVSRVTVRREGQAVALSDLEARLADALGVTRGGRWFVDLTAPDILYAAVDAVVAPRILALTLDDASGRLDVELALAADAPAQRFSGRVEPAVERPVLARPIARGETIGAGDVVWLSLSAKRAPADAVIEAEALIGQAAKRALRPNEPIKAADLIAPFVVKKGEAVLVVYDQGALRLTTRARALSDAAAGEPVRLVNLQSNRSFDAVAVEPGLARVVSADAALSGSRS